MKVSLNGLLWLAVIVTVAVAAWVIIPLQSWQREDIYSSECASFVKNGRYKVVNTATGKTTLKRVDWLHASEAFQRDTLILFSKQGKRGYFNRYSGEVVIPAQYAHAWIFSEGLAAVVKNDKVGFINRRGDVMIDFQYPYYKDNELAQSVVFHGGFCNMRGTNGQCGIIDRQGVWALLPQYDRIENPLYGKRKCELDGKFGLLDEQLNLVLPVEYDVVRLFADYVVARKNGETQQVFSYDGKLLHPFVYDRVEPLVYEKWEGDKLYVQATGCYQYVVGTGCGLLNEKGRRVTQPQYTTIRAVGVDLFQCETDGIVVLLNGKGDVVN